MFWDILNKICKEKNLTPNSIAKEIGASNSTANKWKNGTIPNGETLIKISDYLGVSIDYLLGREDIPNQQIINNNTTVSGTQANSISNYKAEGIELDIINKMKSMSDIQKAELYLTACKLTEKE